MTFGIEEYREITNKETGETKWEWKSHSKYFGSLEVTVKYLVGLMLKLGEGDMAGQLEGLAKQLAALEQQVLEMAHERV